MHLRSQTVPGSNDCGGYTNEAAPSGCDNTCGSDKTDDCNGDCAGSASVDSCGVCAGGNTGKVADADDVGKCILAFVAVLVTVLVTVTCWELYSLSEEADQPMAIFICICN